MEEIHGNINFLEATTLFLVATQRNIFATQEKVCATQEIHSKFCKLIATTSYFMAKTLTCSDEFDYYHNKKNRGKIVN
jgi:hypothetical protein